MRGGAGGGLYLRLSIELGSGALAIEARLTITRPARLRNLKEPMTGAVATEAPRLDRHRHSPPAFFGRVLATSTGGQFFFNRHVLHTASPPWALPLKVALFLSSCFSLSNCLSFIRPVAPSIPRSLAASLHHCLAVSLSWPLATSLRFRHPLPFSPSLPSLPPEYIPASD